MVEFPFQTRGKNLNESLHGVIKCLSANLAVSVRLVSYKFCCNSLGKKRCIFWDSNSSFLPLRQSSHRVSVLAHQQKMIIVTVCYAYHTCNLQILEIRAEPLLSLLVTPVPCYCVRARRHWHVVKTTESDQQFTSTPTVYIHTNMLFHMTLILWLFSPSETCSLLFDLYCVGTF